MNMFLFGEIGDLHILLRIAYWKMRILRVFRGDDINIVLLYLASFISRNLIYERKSIEGIVRDDDGSEFASAAFFFPAITQLFLGWSSDTLSGNMLLYRFVTDNTSEKCVNCFLFIHCRSHPFFSYKKNSPWIVTLNRAKKNGNEKTIVDIYF